MNHHNASHHLSDEDLDDVLIGIGSAEAEAHLAGCAACAARTAEFRSALGSFNQATLAWSEAKSHTLTRDLTAGEAVGVPHLGLAAAGLCGLAVVGALLSVVPGTLHSRTEPSAASAQAAPVDRDREIAGDNAMLQDIDAALYQPEPSPEQTYRLHPARGTSGARPAASEVRE